MIKLENDLNLTILSNYSIQKEVRKNLISLKFTHFFQKKVKKIT